MTTTVILSQGTTDIEVQAVKIEDDISKTWKVNVTPTPTSQQATTTTTTLANVGSVSIVVVDVNKFKVKNLIQIYGVDSTGTQHNESATIKSITGDILTLYNELKFEYVAGAIINKGGRMISMDFNRIIWSVTIHGYITATSTKSAAAVKDELLQIVYGGGSISLLHGGTYHPHGGITKINIEEVPQEGDEVTDVSIAKYDVTLNYVLSGVPIGED